MQSESVNLPPAYDATQRRTLAICGLAIPIGAVTTGVAQILVLLIDIITNISFFGVIDGAHRSPASNTLGIYAILVPIGGALLIGVMARYGSGAIRGHGIPEAIDQILTNESKISPKVTVLKPISAAISIGTGGPFGAEGPIIATGGALGSVLSQLLHTTPDERKTLLAAGAAAGMAAIFGSPVAAVLLAVELLLFEYRPRSLLPVAFAVATATGIRTAYLGGAAVFAMPQLAQPSGKALIGYVVIGALVGLLAVLGTRVLTAIEDLFERLPIHWMWWPALGAVAVGVIGYFEPLTLGVGYSNIENILAGHIAGSALLILVILKYCSWSVALGSGTSGGTLAPLFTVGGGLGALIGILAATWFPQFGIDPRVAALVGMAAMFTGASRALLTSIVFAFETTRQPIGLLPLLGGCSAAYLLSSLTMRYTIMTEKLARRGTYVPTDYIAISQDEMALRESVVTRSRTLILSTGLVRPKKRNRTSEIL